MNIEKMRTATETLIFASAQLQGLIAYIDQYPDHLVLNVLFRPALITIDLEINMAFNGINDELPPFD